MISENISGDGVAVTHAQHHLYLTALLLLLFYGGKIAYENFRRTWAQVHLVIVGAGPIGLTSALIAIKTKKVSKIIIYETCARSQLINRSYQVTFDPRSIEFLKSVGVEFDGIEGCYDGDCFSTKVGVFIEYLLDKLKLKYGEHIKVCFNKKFDKDVCKQLESQSGRLLVIVCDGKKGQSAKILGLDDFKEERTCSAYGAMAAIERTDQRQIPTEERKIHNLNFDLSAYGSFHSDISQNGHPGFSLKIFGNSKFRYLSLIIPKCDSPVIKALSNLLDRSLMRNIFLKCYNTYKLKTEPSLSDSYALNHMKFSPRLFEVKFSQKYETVAYFDDCNTFVTVEGEAAINCNFHTGMDINQGISGLKSLEKFINMITWAETEHAVSSALVFKMQHSSTVFRELLTSAMRDQMFT